MVAGRCGLVHVTLVRLRADQCPCEVRVVGILSQSIPAQVLGRRKVPGIEAVLDQDLAQADPLLGYQGTGAGQKARCVGFGLLLSVGPGQDVELVVSEGAVTESYDSQVALLEGLLCAPCALQHFDQQFGGGQVCIPVLAQHGNCWVSLPAGRIVAGSQDRDSLGRH